MKFLRRVKANNRIKEFLILSGALGCSSMVYRNGNRNYKRYQNMKSLMDKSEAVKQKILSLPEHELQCSFWQEQLGTMDRVIGNLETDMEKFKWTAKFADLMNYELSARFVRSSPKNIR